MEFNIRPEVDCYVAFNTRTGLVVHTHTFIGGGSDDEGRDRREALSESREATVLETAREFSDSTDLRVMHVPPDVQVEAGVLYRVDVESGALVKVAEAPRTMHEFVARARARKARKAAGMPPPTNQIGSSDAQHPEDGKRL